MDSAGESLLRGRVISPVGRMSQHVFLMILNKTLLHSKEILVFGVRGDLDKQQPGIFCRSHGDSAIVAELVAASWAYVAEEVAICDAKKSRRSVDVPRSDDF